MNLFIMLIGLPGSGKSTYIKNSISLEYPDKEFFIASTDNKIEEWALKNNMNYTQAWQSISESKDENLSMKTFEKKMFEEMKNAILENKDIIVDRTNMSSKVRKKFLELIPKSYSKIAVVFKISSEELNNRLKKREQETGKHIPDFVMSSMSKSYEEPTKEEFDKIIFVEN